MPESISTVAREPFRVVGNLLTDLILRGVEEMPAWGEEVAGEGHAFRPSGQATYLAQGLRAFGRQTEVIGLLGDDLPGRAIRASLTDCGAGDDLVETVPDGRTAVTVAVVRPDGERAFISDFACLEKLDEAFLKRSLAKTGGTVCLVGLLNLPGLDIAAARAVLSQARRRGALVALDTGWDPGGWSEATVEAVLALLAEVDLFLPNSDEARVLTGAEDPIAAARVLAEHCAGRVVVKLGRDGCVSWSDGAVTRVGAFPTPVFDTVGAGDSFNAGLLHALADGMELEAAMSWANATASIYVSRHDDRHPAESAVGDLLKARLRADRREDGR